MKMTVISYRDWILNVDGTLTRATYANVKNGIADGCECFDCKNYVRKRLITIASNNGTGLLDLALNECEKYQRDKS